MRDGSEIKQAMDDLKAKIESDVAAAEAALTEMQARKKKFEEQENPDDFVVAAAGEVIQALTNIIVWEKS